MAEEKKKKGRPVDNRPLLRVYFDTETNRPGEDKIEIYYLGYTDDLMKDDYGEYSVKICTKENIMEFFDHLIERNRDYKLELWAHNAYYDAMALYPEYLKSLFEKHEFKFAIGDKTNQFIYCKYYSDELKISFKDTFVWDKTMSLDGYIKLLNLDKKGITKMEIPYDKGTITKIDDEYIYYVDLCGNPKKSSKKIEDEYLTCDVRALPEVVKYIQNTKDVGCNVLSINSRLKKERYYMPTHSTKASYAKYVCSEYLKIGVEGFDKRFRPTTERDMAVVAWNSVIGGFTSFNKYKYWVELDSPKIKSYDVNSMYPDIMAGYVPVGELRAHKLPFMFDPITWYVCTVTECKWKKQYECIARKPYPIKVDKFFITKEFYDFIQTVAETDMKIREIWYQETKPILKGYMDKLYKMKATNQLKAAECKKLNQLDQMVLHQDIVSFVKLAMNSIFGKCLEKTHEKIKLYNQDNMKFEKNPVPVDEYNMNLTGIFIVNTAQTRLLSAIVKEIDNGNEFLYCDTDSIKMIQHTDKPAFDVDNYKLGAWKDEGSYHIYGSLGIAKKYFLWNKDTGKSGLAFSGVTKKMMKKIAKRATLEDWKTIFNIRNNVEIVNGKTYTEVGELYGQPIIHETNFEVNGHSILRLKPTHRLDVKSDVLIRKYE